MKCRDCPDYKMCSSAYDLRIIRKKCEKAKERKPITNYDRIRAMSDEELAEFLDDVRDDWGCSHYPHFTEDWLDWLKQGATEG